MVITNFAGITYTLEVVSASAGAATASFDGKQLSAMIRPLGATPAADTSATATIEGGRSLRVFLELNLDKSKAPHRIEHVRLLDDKGVAHEVKIAPLQVSDEIPIVVAPPLRGRWIAGDSAKQ
jgi:hypothetical protein